MNTARDEFLKLSGAPRWGRVRGLERADAIRVAAIVPLVLSALWSGTSGLTGTFVYASLAVLGAQAIFAWSRARRMETGGLFTAAAFVLLLPAEVPVTHLVLGAVFGVVLGELIFGGRGFGFLNPAVVGLAFVYFSTPAAALPPLEIGLPLAALGSVMLLGAGLADWRVATAALAVFAIAAFAGGTAEVPVTGAGIFAVIFLFADPAVVPLARGARWLTGLLFALLAVLLQNGAVMSEPKALIFAALLASIFAPLIDAGFLALRDAVDRYRGRA